MCKVKFDVADDAQLSLERERDSFTFHLMTTSNCSRQRVELRRVEILVEWLERTVLRSWFDEVSHYVENEISTEMMEIERRSGIAQEPRARMNLEMILPSYHHHRPRSTTKLN